MPELLVKNVIYSHGFAGFTHHPCNPLKLYCLNLCIKSAVTNIIFLHSCKGKAHHAGSH